MESHEVLREAFDKTSPKEIAAALGVSLSLVYKWSQPPEGAGSGSPSPLDRAAELMALTRDPGIIKWLCHKAGGFFVKNPATSGKDYRELVPAMNEIIQEFADLLASITTASLDRRITPDETRDIRRHWNDLKTFTEGFVRACEEGDFDKLQGQSAWTR